MGLICKACSKYLTDSTLHWDHHDLKLDLPNFRSKPPQIYYPLSIPDDIAEPLRIIHDDPAGWWLGQLLLYLMRPRPAILEEFKKSQNASGFRSPIVALVYIYLKNINNINII